MQGERDAFVGTGLRTNTAHPIPGPLMLDHGTAAYGWRWPALWVRMTALPDLDMKRVKRSLS